MRAPSVIAAAFLVALSLPAGAMAGRGHACFGSRATQVGTEGDDVMTGTNGRDVIVALSGRDLVRGLGGSDLICGGDGNDRLLGGSGSDRIGGATSCTSDPCDPGVNELFGGRGHDFLIGGDSGDFIAPGAGSDTIDGRGNELVQDLLLDDTVIYESAEQGVTVNLKRGIARGQGRDAITSVENIIGSDHDDILVVAEQPSQEVPRIHGGPGDDEIEGSSGSDLLHGGKGADYISGLAGNDFLDGSWGDADELFGDDGDDDCVNGEDLHECEENGGEEEDECYEYGWCEDDDYYRPQPPA